MTKDTKEPQPTFNFAKINYRWDKQWMKLMGELAGVSVLASNSVELNENAQPTDQARLNLAQVEAIQSLSRLQAERDQMLIVPLVSVPREWLDDDAPDILNWDDVDSLGWLKGNEEMNMLIKAMNDQKQAKAKN